jgi:hypothetical protein
LAEITRSGPWGQLRFRTAVRDAGVSVARTNEALRSDFDSTTAGAIEALQQEIARAYPTLRKWGLYRRVTGAAVFVGLLIEDAHFIFQEYDTAPHWPPFGKCTELGQWARALGINPFFLARSMAPLAPTDAELPYCEATRGKTKVKMTMHGSGGQPSDRYDGRLVATAGKYVVTDLFDQAARVLDLDLREAVERHIDDFAASF